MARVKTPTCSCEVFNGCVTKSCLMHLRWHRQKSRPMRDLLAVALPNDKVDPVNWFECRDHEFKIIDTTE